MKKIFLVLLSLAATYPFTSIAVHRCNQVSADTAVTSAIKEEILAAHNRYRSELAIPPLKWSDTLAVNAKKWADHLASRGGHLYHSSGTGEGENLWMGTSGYYKYTQMVDSWGSEKKYYKDGTFPNVSSSGKWSDVGHYTQIIWRNTTEVGCAKSTGGGYDVFVCRYSPPGNYIGQKVY